jgi:hypothetical protein
MAKAMAPPEDITVPYPKRHDPCVYFARNCESQFIKIGQSMRLRERLASISNAYAIRLEVLGIIPGGRDVEQRLHARFERYWAPEAGGREWFRPGADLLRFIADEATPYLPGQDPPPFVGRRCIKSALLSMEIHPELASDLKLAAINSYTKMKYKLHEILCAALDRPDLLDDWGPDADFD